MSFLSKIFGRAKKSEAQVEVDDIDCIKTEHFFDDDYFARIINKQSFPDYSIERNVHPSVYDASAHPSCFPVTFMMKKDEIPVLAVMIMKDNQRNAMISRGTYAILENKGIKYIRFYREMANEREYVINRVRENLM